MLIGYGRGRTAGVDALAAQQRVLRDARCGRVVENHASRRQWKLPRLRQTLYEIVGG